jgi:hypothetical protein
MTPSGFGNGPIVFLICVLALGAFLTSLLSTVLRHRRYREALRAEIALRQRLLDKLGSIEELRAYLDSAAAAQLSDLLQPSADESYRRIIRFTVIGAVLLVVGLCSFCVVLWTMRVGSPWPGARLLFFFGGAIPATAGLALVVSAAVSYRMMKAWNLLPPMSRATHTTSS